MPSLLLSPPKNTHGKRSDVLLHPVPGVQHVRAKVSARSGGGEGSEKVQAAEQADGLGELRRCGMLRLSGGSGIASGHRRRGVAIHACFEKRGGSSTSFECRFRFELLEAQERARERKLGKREGEEVGKNKKSEREKGSFFSPSPAHFFRRSLSLLFSPSLEVSPSRHASPRGQLLDDDGAPLRRRSSRKENAVGKGAEAAVFHQQQQKGRRSSSCFASPIDFASRRRRRRKGGQVNRHARRSPRPSLHWLGRPGRRRAQAPGAVELAGGRHRRGDCDLGTTILIFRQRRFAAPYFFVFPCLTSPPPHLFNSPHPQ